MKKLALSLVTVLSLASFSFDLTAGPGDAATVKNELTAYCNTFYANNGKDSEVCRQIMDEKGIAGEGDTQAWEKLDVAMSILVRDLDSLSGDVKENAATQLLQISARFPGNIKLSHPELFRDLKNKSESK